MAAAASFPLPSPNAHRRNLRVAEALRAPDATVTPAMTATAAYDLLAATSVGADAAALELGGRKILGRFVTFSAPQRRAIKGSGYRTNDLVMPTKTGGVEVIGSGGTWEEACRAARLLP